MRSGVLAEGAGGRGPFPAAAVATASAVLWACPGAPGAPRAP